MKKDGTRMPFERERMLRGIHRACFKRPIEESVLHKLVEVIEDELVGEFDREVSSQVIGARVSDKLRDLDHVAYVRFASVYREFKDLDDMIDEITDVKDRSSTHAAGQQPLFE